MSCGGEERNGAWDIWQEEIVVVVVLTLNRIVESVVMGNGKLWMVNVDAKREGVLYVQHDK